MEDKKTDISKYKKYDGLLKVKWFEEDEERISLNEQIALAIINARKEDCITQKELEEMSGVPQPFIARIESGKIEPKISTVVKLLESMERTLKVVPY